MIIKCVSFWGDDICGVIQATVQGTLRVIGVVNERNRFPVFLVMVVRMLFNVEAGGNLILKNLNIETAIMLVIISLAVL